MGVYDFLVVIIIMGFIFQADQALSVTCNSSSSLALANPIETGRVVLDLSSDAFSGYVPADIQLPSLKNLNCSTLATLSTLDLASNRFTGPIPNNFPTFLLMNFHNEELPADPTLHFQKLKVLIIAIVDSQEPSPDFPLFLKRNVNIKGWRYNHFQSFPPTLDLSYNNLSGPIWPEFANLRKLHILVLKFNKISGPIPSSLSDNQLYGEIPPRGNRWFHILNGMQESR
ncbi:hypothetical protein FEM48_Zijuj09G0182200 [Ziziphus jujuba var. spinosa]|uniref:Uncharacterized protein n=1 Tax=Ziziphus jujuba var. spinosa TaxID=714518 RepID=A0A978UUI8_ZIZJJ|nr:hypothetical protein FEM48_Zijuj09G0182200 [Ziziphus jujuba var. spinosa]